MSTHAAAPDSLTQADLDHAGPLLATPWTIDDLRRGRVFRARISANPRPDARWPWRVTALDGRPLPKVGLLRDHDRGDGTSIRLLAIRPLADTVDPLFGSAEPAAETARAEPPLTVR
jgi:hypothetical protein